MTKSARPNLGGLFNGTTPPERSSRISDAVGPRSPRQPPAVGRSEVARPAATPPRAARSAEKGSAVPAEAGPRRPVLPGIDPVRVVDRYFEVLQAVLDLNHAMALAWADLINSASRRLLPRR